MRFCEFENQDAEWRLSDITFGQSTLIVGRNSTGKTRVLNVINGLARVFTGRQKEVAYEAKFRVNFQDSGHTWAYELEHDNDEVLKEELHYDGTKVLHRSKGGLGKSEGRDEDDKPVQLRIKVPKKQLALVAKRDEFQAPYLEGIHKWAESLRIFRFGSEMDATSLAVAVDSSQIIIDLDEQATSRVIPILQSGLKKFPTLKEAVIRDMARLGYELSDVMISRPPHTIFHGMLPGEVVGAAVRETNLKCITSQLHMSTGMFRAFSLIVQLNYYLLSSQSGCILVDDIGDGLDFERTCTLIDLLREKSAAANVQLIMTSNNRFVMNKVPFEEWCVLHRDGGYVRAANYSNSKDKFEEFRLTGLSNFDLFRTDYLFK